MRTYLDCFACLVRQALEAARMAGADDDQQRVVMNLTLDALRAMDPASTPPEISDTIHRLVSEHVGNDDPYRSAKEESTRQALALYPELKQIVAEAPDPLDAAVRLAIAGNIIDLGPQKDYDLEGTIERVLTQCYAVDDGPALRKALGRVESVLYLGTTRERRSSTEC